MSRERTGEAGYLYEVPLLAIVVGVVGMVLVKFAPYPWMAWTVCALVSIAVGFFLWYNFLAPGWLPGGLKQQVSISGTVLLITLALATPPMGDISPWAAVTTVFVSVGGLILMLAIRGILALIARNRQKDPPAQP